MARVLIACEFSGIVRDAFIEAGHDAVSCDLLPSERPGLHVVMDALEAIELVKPDLLIAHPPCQYLANSGVRWLYIKRDHVNVPDMARWLAMHDGAMFFRRLLEADVPHVAVENPVMHGYAREIIGAGPTQFIQPWQFGHPETKATGLWLRNLPPLVPTNIVPGREPRVHRASPGPDRWKERSRTLPGIAAAMADQWGTYVEPQLRAAA
jgi:hypothetical protein